MESQTILILQGISTLCDVLVILRRIIPYLALISNRSIEPVLRKFLADGTNEKRREILLKSMQKNEKCIDSIIAILAADETDEQSRHLIFKLLSDFSSTNRKIHVTERINRIIEEGEGKIDLQIECMNVLGAIKGIDSITVLNRYAACDSEWRLSAAVIENLGKIGSEKVLGTLLSIPPSSHHRVLEALAIALGSIPSSPESLSYLYVLLNHQMPHIREAAAVAIGNLDENIGALDSLCNLKKQADCEDDSGVVNAIGDAMKRINRDKGKEFLEITHENFYRNKKFEFAHIIIYHYQVLKRRG